MIAQISCAIIMPLKSNLQLTFAVARIGISYLTGEAQAIPSRLSEPDAERLIFWCAARGREPVWLFGTAARL